MLTLFTNLGVVCVDDYPAVGRAIASVAAPTLPVVMRVFDLHWVQSVIRTRFVERFSGLDPYSVLEFLKPVWPGSSMTATLTSCQNYGT